MYGIKVTSTYGRTLSRFAIDPSKSVVDATELFTLPYMWYVNASTFDQTTNRYFGLINYFPNQPGTVDDQQLVVCDFNSAAGDCKVVAIEGTFGAVHFISYGMATKQLYFASFQNIVETQEKRSIVSVGVLDAETGHQTLIWSHPFKVTRDAADYQLIGPLVFQESDSALSVFMRETVTEPWELYRIPANLPSSMVATFKDVIQYAMISAATKFV